MSYLERLIERATDTTLDLENNVIGNYRITPQHGANLVVYHIYKNNARPDYNGNRRYDNCHVVEINIFDNEVIIWVNPTYLNVKEINDVINTINNLYSTFDITYSNMITLRH